MRMIDVDSYIRISVLGKRNELIHLDIVCDSNRAGIGKHFKNQASLEEYINRNGDTAFKQSIYKIDNTHYILNCETGYNRMICSEEKWLHFQGQQIVSFMPIIRKFMEDAMTGRLEIEKQSK